jgi:hypothetical protein
MGIMVNVIVTTLIQFDGILPCLQHVIARNEAKSLTQPSPLERALKHFLKVSPLWGRFRGG